MNSADYLDAVMRVIRENFRSKDPSGSMPVAAAAFLARQSIGADQTSFGFPKFKDVLNELERQGLLRTGSDSSSAYAIWLSTDSSPNALSAVPPIQARIAFRPLRTVVWHAFVADAPAGQRYLNRATGEVKVGVHEPLLPYQDWVEIRPINPLEERDLSRKFLDDHDIHDTSVRMALDSPRWYYELPRALTTYKIATANEWKRWRSGRIIEMVERWCDSNNIPRKLVYESFSPQNVSEPVLAKQSGLRQILLSAIAKMSTDQLLELRIPARHLIEVLRPDLLEG